MDVEGTPLLGAGKEITPLHVKIPGANCLGAQAVKQRYLCPWSYTHWRWEDKKWESQRISASLYSCVGWHILQLTIGIFQGLFLLGGLGDDLDSFTEKEPNVGAVPIQHLHRQHEVFPFVWVTDIQCLSCAEVLRRKRQSKSFSTSPGNKTKWHWYNYKTQKHKRFSQKQTAQCQTAQPGKCTLCCYFALFIHSKAKWKNKYPFHYECRWRKGAVIYLSIINNSARTINHSIITILYSLLLQKWLNHKLNKNINILTLINYLFSTLFIHLFVLFSWIRLGGSGHIQTQAWCLGTEWL